jgi:hypothetical protein
LRFFVIQAVGLRRGVHESDATMLGYSFGEVESRIGDGGRHTAPLATEVEAARTPRPIETLFTLKNNVRVFWYRAARVPRTVPFESGWAPDADEAFDDGSYVLQFDVDGRVRLIAFKIDERWPLPPWRATPKTPEYERT